MKPLRTAAIVALAYLVPSLIYIAVSTQVAADIAVDPEQAMMIEIIKGLTFVTLSAGLIFGVCWKTLSIVENRRQQNQLMREALLHAERQAMTGLLAASVAHDAHNELAVLKSNNEFLERHEGLDETTSDVINDQQVAIERLINLTTRLTDAGEYQASNSVCDVDIATIAAEVIESLRHHSRLKGCTIRLKSNGETPAIDAYPILIHQILVNLIFNAADAIGGQGRIEIHVDSADSALNLEVHDSGPGIPDSEREHVFDAFYTTKDSGTGLGLLSVKACALAHGGSAEIVDSPLGGACIRVLLSDANPELYDNIDAPLLTNDRVAGSPS